MKKYFLLIIVLLLIPIVSAQQINDFNDASYINMRFSLDTGVQFTQQNSNPRLEDFTAELSFVPHEEEWQEVTSLNYLSSPNSEISGKEIVTYKWNTLASDFKYTFGVESNIKNTNVLHLIDEKVSFPLDELNSKYVDPSEMIDIDEDIKKQALELAEGETDLYVVTFKIANWVEKNIEYDLSTLTEDVVQPSSWVLKNKKGVCDELTNLFISMMRSLGVPARFVSGMAYTNTIYDWGPHAWAEVYFPDKGWVPVDVTYGQFGWVDPTHLKLKQNLDSGDPSIKYKWRANGLDFEAGEVDMKTTLVDQGPKINNLVTLEVKPLVNKVGPGSYVPMEVTIINNQENYIPDSLYIVKGQQLFERNIKRVLLPPKGKKTVYWINKVSEFTDKGYVYTGKFAVEDQFHTFAETEITFANNYDVFTKEQAEELVRNLAKDDEKVYSPDLSTECLSSEFIYSYETVEITCTLTNKGNTGLNFHLCVEETCEPVSLGISEKTTISLNDGILEPGLHTLEILVDGDVKIKDYITLNILEAPGLILKDFQYDKNPNYQDDLNINFTMYVDAPITNVRASINNEQSFMVESIEETQKVNILTPSSRFYDSNYLLLDIKYKDENGKEYKFSKDYKLEVINPPWYIKLFNWIGLV